MASLVIGLGEEHTIHNRRVFSSWLLFGAFFGLRGTMRRLGSFLFWLLSEDIELARYMKHYFYTTDDAPSNHRSNKINNLDIN